LIDYINLVENQLDCTVKTIRSDQGGEFESHALRDYLKAKGIEHHFIPTAAHAQNGRVERAHLTILNQVRTLLIDRGLDDKFWAKAANYAIYTRNRAPTGSDKHIPEDLWRQREVNSRHLQPFGCQLWFRDHNNTNKLHPCYKEGQLLSYVEGTDNYRIWDLHTEKVIISRDVVFGKQPKVSTRTETSGTKIQSTQVDIDIVPEPTSDSDSETEEDQSAEDHTDTLNSPDQPGDDMTIPSDQATQATQATQAKHKSSGIWSKGWDVAPVPTLENPVLPDGSQRVRKPPAKFGYSANLATAMICGHALISTAIPQTFQEAHRSPEWDKWQEAIKAELDKMDQYKVWSVIDRQEASSKPLRAKWVFTRKIDGETGKPSAYKARWVAKGFLQKEGVDYNELYAGVAHKDTI
jgi:hypothetical protein